ncbi:hypothetical protein BDZ88DRAFT_395507 [Geranomyces variabilis]|nr:hypothetical protein BDZ88DRAFT_395507 [Geranomyces variabilis]KAJ3136305.1 hypothetical protein HDU90_003357 [Geranomyces variabilis]
MIFTPDETIDIPELDITTLTFSVKFPDETVYLLNDVDGTKITHGDMRRMYPKFTAGLQSAFGWQPGQVLAVVSWNSIHYPAICWGTLAAGGVVMGLNPGFTADELVMRMTACRPNAIFVAVDLLDTVLAVTERINFPTDRIVLMPNIEGKSPVPTADVARPSVWGWHSALFVDNIQPQLLALKGVAVRDHPAFIIFSSGTTGIPKAAQLTHYNYCAMIARMAADRANLLFGDNAPYLVLPFWAQPGISHCLIAGFFLGYPTVITPSYDFPQLLALVQKHRPRQLQTTPQIVNLLARDSSVDKYDLSSLTHVLVAGAPTSREAITLCQDRLGVQVLNNYGLTEMTLLVTRNLPGDNRVGSVGRLYLNTEAKILGDDERALGYGKQGELLIRAPGVLNAYIGKTREESGIDSDGFMKTGDMAIIDESGYVYITDRKNELFKCQDRLVAPALIENVLFTHPAVRDCCVIPVWADRKSTYLPRAYLVLAGKYAAVEYAQREELVRDVMAFVAERVKPHMALLGGVVVVDSLPRHESGKVLRKKVKEVDALADAVVVGMF